MTTRKKFAFGWLSDNLLIALVPLVGTYMAFIFQWSYFRFYGIPPSLIELDVPKIIFAITAIVFAAVIFLMLVSHVARFTASSNPVVKILGTQLIVVVFLLPIIIGGLGVLTKLQVLFYATVFLVLGLISYIPPLNKPGEKLSYLQRLRQRQEQYEISNLSEKADTTLHSKIGQRVIAPAILVAFGSFYVSMLGFVSAGMVTTHNVLKSQPDAIYVTKSQDYFVFVRYDGRTNTLKNQLLFLQSTADKPIELVEVNTGPLLPPSK